VAALDDPVIVSAAANVPTGTVIVKVVAEGLVIISAVALLVPPVIVSPIEKEPDAATLIVMAPRG
tara:strand:+ start:248 stop:442 length:195 start_codon:yes stop_codon:yes gene_type:complete